MRKRSNKYILIKLKYSNRTARSTAEEKTATEDIVTAVTTKEKTATEEKRQR